MMVTVKEEWYREWNRTHLEWLDRERKGEGQLKLCDGDFRKVPGLAMRGSNWSGAHFQDCNFDRCDFRQATMDGASFYNCSFQGTQGTQSSWVHCALTSCSFKEASYYKVNFLGSSFQWCNFEGALLQESEWKWTSLTRPNFAGAKLDRANLVIGGQDMMGHAYYAFLADGVVRVRAGCRDFTLQEAYSHWMSYKGERKTEWYGSSIACLEHIKMMAKAKGWISG